MEAVISQLLNPRKAKHRPPQVPRVPLLGNYFDIKKTNVAHFLRGVQRQYGDIANFSIFGNEFFLISNPEDIENILIRDNANFEKDKGLRLLKKYALGTSLLTSEGEVHKEMRKQSSKAFSRKNINSYSDTMAEITREHIAAWKTGDVRNIHEEMMAITAKIAAVTLFHMKVDERVLKIGQALGAILELTNYLVSPIAEVVMSLPGPLMQGVKRGLKDLDEIIYSFIDEHLKGMEKPDFLSQLIAAKKEQGIDLSTKANRTQLRDEALTIFLAGHETTANALTWTWTLLSQYPQEVQKMREEVGRVAAGANLDVEKIGQLEYTRQIFSEAMRLYPPAWSIGRYVKEDYEIRGYTIPKNTEIWMSQFVVHHDPRWYADADKFLPSRFSEAAVAARPRMSYFPFSAGPRNCIGEQFAWLEGAIVLAEIAQRFDLYLTPDTRLEIMPQVTLRPKNPVMMRVKAR